MKKTNHQLKNLEMLLEMKKRYPLIFLNTDFYSINIALSNNSKSNTYFKCHTSWAMNQ
jgi:hypothetical protein